MNDHWAQILRDAAPYVCTSAFGLIFKAIAGRIDAWDKSIRANTKATETLNSNLASLKSEMDSFRRETMERVDELRTKSREQEAELRLMGERSHAIVNALTSIHGVARGKGWRELPDLDFPVRT